MTEEQRIEKIDELLERIGELNYNKIFLDTHLHFLRKNTQSSGEDAQRKINEMQDELVSTNRQLALLFTQLRQHQFLYFVEYDGEFSTATGHGYSEKQREYLYFNTDCNIDTLSRGWNPYVNDPNVRQLLKELHRFLTNNRFSIFTIHHIKRQ